MTRAVAPREWPPCGILLEDHRVGGKRCAGFLFQPQVEAADGGEEDARGESGFFETPSNDLETCRDFLQGRLPRDRAVHIDEIEIDRETRHFSDEKVDGRASLEREWGAFKYIRSDAEHQLHGFDVGLIHS